MIWDKTYSNNTGTEDSLKVNIDYIMSSVLPTELRCTVNNIFVRCNYVYVLNLRNIPALKCFSERILKT